MSTIEPQPPRRSRRWIWVFAAFALLGALAISINWVYNSGEPLTREKLAAARALWKRERPADYNLKIGKASTSDSGTMIVDKFELQVRGGKVVSFLVNGKEPEPLIAPDGARNVEAERRQREYYDIDGLFNAIEELMDMDERDKKKSFLRARFDKKDGHVTLFTRQLQGRRVPHIEVEMRPPN